MLNTKERHGVLTFLRYFCKVGVLPLQVDVDGWDIHPGVKSSWKKLACRVSFAVYFVNILYKNFGLLYALVFAPDTALHQLVLHMILAGGAAMISFWYYILYVQYPGTYAIFARMTLTANIIGSKK